MSVKIGINGFGRIGRLVFRAIAGRQDVQVVATNDLTDPKTLAHLLKYDSVHGRYAGTVKAVDGGIEVDGRVVKVLSERDPAALPWKELGVDTVVITGLMSFMCCDTTARDAHSRGYKVFFVQDATAAIDLGEIKAQQAHEVTLAVQGFVFSEVIRTEEVLERMREE